MIPPLVRRCPDCGHLNLAPRFAVVESDAGRQVVRCPACEHRFETADTPLLN